MLVRVPIGIAMGLVEHGPDRMGEVLSFTAETQDETRDELTTVEAKIVSPVFFDPKGEKQDV